MRLSHVLTLFLSLSIATSALAGSEIGSASGKGVVTPVFDPFAKGATEIETLGGYFHSPAFDTHRIQLDYAVTDVRYGMILSPTLFDNTLLRGNVEFLADVFGADITKGPGNYLAGASLLFRYNLVQPGSHLVPYIQLGGGGLHSDAAQDHTQRLIGSDFEFTLQADIGLRYLITDRWSLVAEGGFQHISNADTASRNVGVNALGGRLGLGWAY
jgi:opacity protein-like surface antigen